MFRENTFHLQGNLFGIESQLPTGKVAKLRRSREYAFYKTIFCNIREEDFAALFSESASRPNAPVNVLVSAVFLMQMNGWTTRQLFDRVDFDILTRTALGLDDLEETPFCPATFFNFRNRLVGYYGQTEINLLERCFEHLTDKQLKQLRIKTSIQRTDSFLAFSNIRSYSRLQLLVEVLIRLERILSEQDKLRYAAILRPYVKQGSEHYVYDLDREEIPDRLTQLGAVYHTLYEALKGTYGHEEAFCTFERVWREHFTVTEGDKVDVTEAGTLTGSSLQSPDDLDAAYRHKNGKHYKGQSVNVVETCHPDNELNLITDVSVYAANTDDSTILADRIETIRQKTPELEELHSDGAYGSEANDETMDELGVRHVATEVRGRRVKVRMVIDEVSPHEYRVSCPHQTVSSEKGRKRYKACFDKTICEGCALSDACPAKVYVSCRTYYFERSDYLLSRRLRNLEALPPQRQHLRANVEATVKEFTGGFNHKGKLRVRGGFMTAVYALSMAAVINFGRIWRHISAGGELLATLQAFLSQIVVLRGLPKRRPNGRDPIALSKTPRLHNYALTAVTTLNQSS